MGVPNYPVYDEAGRLLGEYTGAGNLIQEIVWLEELPVASLRPRAGGGVEIYYVHADHLGTPRVITAGDAQAKIVWRWDSDPFGAAPANEDPDGDGAAFAFDLRFPGQYLDRETGLHYNYFRDYDPTIGRYVQSDPIGLRGGINTYAYANNDPLSFVDPLGLVAWSCRATDSGGTGAYRGNTKVCRYVCGAKCYPTVTVDARGWNSSAGSHCYGQDVGTQATPGGQRSDNPIGPPKSFDVETDGVQSWLDRFRYPSELLDALKAGEKNKSACCK